VLGTVSFTVPAVPASRVAMRRDHLDRLDASAALWTASGGPIRCGRRMVGCRLRCQQRATSIAHSRRRRLAIHP
jgi:hypothetical protein